jgi:serine/threonine protein kinase
LLDGTGATASGQLLGTPAFMPPEQANGRVREIDPRSDLWSVGAIMFTTISGKQVHEARTSTEQLVYAATQEARPLESAASWVPRDVAKLVNRALAFERSARWQSAREMQQALRAMRAYDVLSATVQAVPSTVRAPAVSAETLVHGSVRRDTSPMETVAFDLVPRPPGERDPNR